MLAEADPRVRGVAEIVRGIADGDLTAETVMADCLGLIEERDGPVGAWTVLNGAGLEQARAIDAGQAPKGGLTGVPIGVKDVIETRCLPTAYGSALYRANRPAADAACVALGRSEGAVVLGKTVSTEFAFITPGDTRNPHNGDHTPGGSSSGSAAAVAAGMVPAAYGTQTSGSVIRPASFCGVVGCKPSFGLIDRSGTKTLAQSLDTIGIFSRSVTDIRHMLASITGRPALRGGGADAAPRLGLFLPPECGVAEDYTIDILTRAARAAQAAGAVLRNVVPTAMSRRHLEIHEGVMDHETVSALSDERLFNPDGLAPLTLETLADWAARSTIESYDVALDGMRDAQAAFPELIGDNDVLLTLAAAGEAPEGLGFTGDPTFNRGWTMLHVPCITVPAGRGPKGLPVGVQIVGRHRDDLRVLQVAEFVERALGDVKYEGL